jgi:deoxycytidylate deaminase
MMKILSYQIHAELNAGFKTERRRKMLQDPTFALKIKSRWFE